MLTIPSPLSDDAHSFTITARHHMFQPRYLYLARLVPDGGSNTLISHTLRQSICNTSIKSTATTHMSPTFQVCSTVVPSSPYTVDDVMT